LSLEYSAEEVAMRSIWLLLITSVFTLSLIGCAQRGLEKIPEITDLEKEMDFMLTEGGVRYIVDPTKIVSGGPPMDGIPSIDNPKFVSVSEADQWIQDNELVLAIIYKRVKRVYPLQIMSWHEIVNDNIASDPMLITY
jgi:hypothetical protein